MIKVIFTNGTTSVDLQFVRSVQWQSEASREVLVNQTTRVGKTTRTLTINGFINKGMFTDNVQAQQQLESNLIAVGTGTIQYTGASDITSVRFSSIEFEEFRGNPICPFTIEFVTEEPNVHAHTPVRINSLTLDAANGYDNVKVSESTTTQGPDEQLVNNLSKMITITGSIIGATLNDINLNQQKMMTEIDNTNAITLTLSATSGNYIATIVARPRKLDFSAPRLRGELASREFIAEFSTYDDYTKEPYTLGEKAVVIGGITIDVVTSFDHNKEYEYATSNGAYTTLEETVEISGKKYFSNYDAYDTFRQLFTPIPDNAYLYTSNTTNVLQLTDITVGAFERDGNFNDTTKRYSASVSLTFTWRKSIEQTNFAALVNYFGVTFNKVPSITFSASVDQYGNVTSKSINMNGEIKGENQLNNFKALLGSAVTYDASLTNLYVTSTNVSGVTTVNDGGIRVKVYSVSLSAAQLDTSTQANYFIAGLFDMSRAGGTPGTIQFEHITSLSKSIANRWDSQTFKFIVTSITISVSGDVFTSDNGAGKPFNANKIVELFNRVDSLMTAELSLRAANTHTSSPNEGFNVLPSNSQHKYMLNNISVSDWQPAVAPENLQNGNGARGARYWRQNVSVSAIAVYDLSDSSSGSTNEPDFVDSYTEEVEEEVPKFTQLQVINFGTVFKRIGTTPSRCTVTSQRQFRDMTVYKVNEYGSIGRPQPITWAGIGRSSVISRETRENNPPTNRWTVEYEATEKLSNT